jgi:hypothetical protein
MPSIVDRYARPPQQAQSSVHELSQGAMQQVQEAGKALAAMGTKHTTVQGQGVQSQATPAQKYGRQAPTQQARGRSLSR